MTDPRTHPGPCRLCGATPLRLHYTQGSDGRFRFFRCRICGLVSCLDAAELDQEKYATTFPDPLDERLRTNRSQTRTYDFIRSRIRWRGQLLDIGCGNGRLLHLAQRDGWRVKGLELSPFLGRKIRERFGIEVVAGDFLTYTERAQGAHDLVVLRHVLEHIPDPLAAMARLRELLRDGGHAVLEFPNIEAPGLRFKRWLDRTGLRRKRYPAGYRPGHHNEFSRRSFRFLARRTGFRVLVWQTYSHKPLLEALYRRIPAGDKARVLIRKDSGEEPGGAHDASR